MPNLAMFKKRRCQTESWDMMSEQARAEHGRDEGGKGLGPKEDYTNVVVAEYVWVDALGVPRSKTKTLSKRPTPVTIFKFGHWACPHTPKPF